MVDNLVADGDRRHHDHARCRAPFPAKPGSATLPFFGVRPVLVDDQGKELEGNGVSGNLCLRGHLARGRRERSTATTDGSARRTSRSSPGSTSPGDGCRRDEDGYYWITGRVDGRAERLGPPAGDGGGGERPGGARGGGRGGGVGFPHDIKGTGIFAYVQPNAEFATTDPEELIGALKQQVRQAIGPFATPDRIQIVAGLPKTRSGKIMRRILRKIAAGEYEELGDITTLADPSVVEKLVSDHRQAT